MSTIPAEVEPTSFTFANKSVDARLYLISTRLYFSMASSMLVLFQNSMNIVCCKWVYKIEKKMNGTMERYKVWLVAKGFHQQPHLNFGETYSPVVKPVTVQVILSLAIS